MVTQLRTDGVHCREFAGTGPVDLEVVPVTGAAILQDTMDQIMCASLFPPIIGMKGACLKKNQTTPRPSEHPPVMGEIMSKRLGGIKRLQIQNLFMAFKQVPRCR